MVFGSSRNLEDHKVPTKRAALRPPVKRGKTEDSEAGASGKGMTPNVRDPGDQAKAPDKGAAGNKRSPATRTPPQNVQHDPSSPDCRCANCASKKLAAAAMGRPRQQP